MRIEEIVLHGFKSFAERTVVPLLPGVTAVVGPNGSGKSNLVEAIRFVIGARTRRLRGGGPEDLVFQGAPGRRPAGFAEVRLRMHADRRFELLRRIYRDGRQEARLDGRRASLKELSLALAGTGLGPGGNAIIGQGQVAGVVEAPPERLFAFLVEAAGLSEVEARIQEAEAKLAAASARMTEERERYAELELERARLSEAARLARRARELEAERLALRRGLLQSRLEEARKAAEEARASAERARAEAERLREAAAFAEREATYLARRYEHVRDDEARLGELRSSLTAERRGLSERLALARENLALLERRERELLARLSAFPTPPEAPEPERPVEALRRELAELEAERRTLRRRLEEAERAYRRYLEQYARYRGALEAYERALEERRREARRVWALEKALAEKLPRLRAQLLEQAEVEAALERLRTRERQARAELAAIEAEHSRVRRALEEGQGLAEGPKRLLAAGLPGVLGSVARLIAFPPELREAAEAALGGRLSWVVVEDEPSLKRAVAWLKERGFRATLLARTLARPPGERPVPDCPGILGRLREWVHFEGDPRLSRTVVGETLLAEDLDAALACFKQHPRRIVTRGGELLEPTGAVSGGRSRRHGLLELPARVRELETEREAIVRELERLAKERDALEARRPETGALSREVSAILEELRLLHQSLARPLPEPGAPPEAVPEPDWSALSSLEEREHALREALLQAEAWARYRAAEAERPRLEEELAAIRARREEGRVRMARLLEAETRLEAWSDRVTGLLEGVRAALGELAKARERRLLEASRAQREADRKVAEAEEAELTAVRKETQAEALAAELAELPPGPAASGGLARLRAVERAIADLGPVNFRAEVELEALEARLKAQSQRLAEAEEAHARLQRFLAELKRDFEDRLKEAETRLGTAFAEYVRGLLGGEGRIRREGRGLALELAPAGKRVRALSLFSTGEKTMGALALLFALAEVREGGLPIAVLDEVDAALDEANLARFVRFLKHFKKGRQVLIVTHQKRTLEAADAVVGVTSTEGVSRVYTLRRAEAG